MRLVALEEHFTFPDIQKRVPAAAQIKRGYPPPDAPSARPATDDALKDFGDARLKSMDDNGVSLQVMGPSGPGADLLPPNEGPAFAREINDALAAEIARRPTRYAGFAHLPMTAPEAAADELERCVKKLGFHGCMVNGTTEDRFLDDRRFEPILARCEALDVPLYLHPGIPPLSVREAYYGNLPGPLPTIVARAGFGWHTEVAVHVLRLVLSGALDRHPKLQIIIGHQGEGLPAMMERFEESFHAAVPKFLQRNVNDAIHDQVHVTTSGFYSLPSFTMLHQVFGIDRILFSVDYPFSAHEPAKAFFDQIVLSPADRAKFAHGNAEKLLKLKPQA